MLPVNQHVRQLVRLTSGLVIDRPGRLHRPASQRCPDLRSVRNVRPCTQVHASSSSALSTSEPAAGDGQDGVGLSEGGGDAPATYIRRPLKAGDRVQELNNSVIVVGDVPEGCTVVAGGDVIVMGTLNGEAQAGASGNRESMVVAFQRGASARVSVAGISAPQQPGTGQMAVLEGAAAVYKAMPGSERLLAPAAASGGPPTVELGQLGSAAVLLLGLGLAVAPATVLGSLLHSSGESITSALLETAVWGYIILQGAVLLGDGSEMLLEILNPGIIGGVVLPLLGAVPDSLIILNSGLHASPEDAQQEVAVGVGTLAGSSILLLSLAWGGSILLGRCDLDDKGRAKDKTLTRGWDLNTTGVTVDDEVRQGALIMAASVLLYGFVQVPAVLGFPNDPTAALVGSIVCLASTVAYCIYSVVVPERQKRLIDAARKKRFRQYAVQAMARHDSDASRYGGLVDANGQLNAKAVNSLFEEFDTDKSGVMDAKELSGLLLGLKLTEGMATGGGSLASVEESVKYVMQEFDLNKDDGVTKDEFQQVLSKWVSEHSADGAMLALVDPERNRELLAELPADDVAALQAIAADLESKSKEELVEDEEDEEHRSPLTAVEIGVQASLKLAAGVGLCALFSEPLVDALTNLSKETGIPPFFAGFVLTPLASNASEVLSSLGFAARKRRKNMSLTFSQVYGAVTMNNTLVLGLFLLVVYLQHLDWVYSSEVTVIAGASILIGAMGYGRSTLPALAAVPAIAIYPASLAIIYVLDTYLGWQ